MIANLWEPTDAFFNLPSASPDNCATFTYRLYESITNQEFDENLFFINVDASIPFVRFTLPTRDPWLINQPFEFILEAIYGDAQGAITISDPIDVTVIDPCFKTKITP